MKKLLFALILSLPIMVSAQSETHDFITYDTTIIYHFDPFHSFTYFVRISRPRNLFTLNNPDTASRPAFFMMPGAGEMTTDTPTNLITYGPHYFLNQGTWDGGIQLGNGKHYPILFTMLTPVSPPQPPVPGNYWVMDYLIHHYHIKSRGVHLTGLSEGSFTWTGMIGLTDTTGTGTTGADIGMREVTSVTNLSGAATTSGNFTEFGHWAKKYGGKAFITVGYADAQTINPPQMAENMNDSVPGSAYFSYNSIGSGSHCCWNTDWDPNLVLWNSVTTPLGTWVVNSTHINYQGPYTSPTSIFQQMLRMGDTTLVGNTVPPIKKVITMEYWATYWAHNDTMYANVGGSSTPVAMPLPSGELVAAAAGKFNALGVVSNFGKVYTSSTYNAGSNSWTQQTTDSNGTALTNVINIWALQNTYVIEKADSSIWMGGPDDLLLYHSTGTINMRPILLSNADKFVKVVLGGQYVAASTSTGKIYVWRFGQGALSGITPTIYTMTGNATDLATGGYNSVLAIVGGKIFALGSSWGTWGATTAANYTTFTDISAIWSHFPYTVISMTTQATHAITSTGNMWGTGYNVQGEVGNGQEFVNRFTYVNWRNYGWDFGDFENPVGAPVQVGIGKVWTALYDNEFFTFYKYAQDNNGNIYSCGRGKTYVLGNGLYTGDAFNMSNPNILDVDSFTLVTPLTTSTATVNPTLPIAPITGTQNVTSSSILLTITGHPLQYQLASTPFTVLCCSYTNYAWVQEFGPTTASFSSTTTPTPTVSGLVSGQYGFRVQTTDNKGALDTGLVVVNVSIIAGPFVAISGGPQTIFLPANSTTLIGAATAQSPATITGTLWTQVSGPSTATIGSPTSTTTTITNMIQGTYQFKLTATDSNNNTAFSTVNVTVMPSTTCNCATFSVPVHF